MHYFLKTISNLLEPKLRGSDLLARIGGDEFAFIIEHVSSTNEVSAIIEDFIIALSQQIDTMSNYIFGIEVLLRWRNEILGDVLPSEFIPIAEVNGCVHEIGEWVIKKACSEYNKLVQSTKNTAIHIAVNVSIKQLDNDNLFLLIKKLYETYPALKNHLILEITETAFMQNPKHTMHVFYELRGLNVRFALDDFGIGYSSMLHLKKFDVSFIKIDKNFIKNVLVDENDAAIVKGTVQLANSLGIQVIAEGVETKSQLEFLKEMGCYLVQGYYIAKPMPFEKLEAFLMKSYKFSE